MNAIDGTEHYEWQSEGPPPSLLVIILDTNLHAWAAISDVLPLSKALANLLVFINAHLAFNHSNKIAVIASHCNRTAWLYPSAEPTSSHTDSSGSSGDTAPPGHSTSSNDANKYHPFRLIEEQILRNLRNLLSTTTTSDLSGSSTTSTMIAGALTLALSYINKTTLSLSSSNSVAPSHQTAYDPSTQQTSAVLNSRILIVSTSGDLATQYIPIMNLIFAASHLRVPIDILKLAGDTVLLQQASHSTQGVYLSPAITGQENTNGRRTANGASTADEGVVTNAQGILQYLLQAFLPDASARRHLIPPTAPNVDFRAACFCHRRVVDIGFVCSICLSIFCEELVVEEDGKGTCLTCGTRLRLGEFGAAGAAAKKRKKRRRDDGAEVTT